MSRSWIQTLCLALLLASPVWPQGAVEKLVRQADQAYRAGNLNKATKLLDRALKRDPSSAAPHMLLGIIRAQREQWAPAIGHFQAVLASKPADPFAHYLLGKVYQSKQSWADAALHISKALENQHPERARLTLELANAHARSGRPQQAVRALQGVPEPSEPSLAAQYHSAMALALAAMDQPFPALEGIQKALKSDSGNVESWVFYTSSLISTDQKRMALTIAMQAQRVFADHPDIQYHFGLASYYVTETPFTKLALRNLREARPEDPRLSVLQGLVAHKSGQTEEAKQALSRAAEAGVAEAPLFLGVLLAEGKNYAEAERSLGQAERQIPHDGQVLLELGSVLLARKNASDALSRLHKAEQYMPKSARVQQLLSQAYALLGNPEKAEHHGRRSQELQSGADSSDSSAARSP